MDEHVTLQDLLISEQAPHDIPEPIYFEDMVLEKERNAFLSKYLSIHERL